MPTEKIDVRRLARQFHDSYERLAPRFGYETHPETREFDPESPNGRLMQAVCAEVARIVIEECAKVCEADDPYYGPMFAGSIREVMP